MTATSSPGPTVPNCQNICVGELVAEAMSKSNLEEQKQQGTQKSIDEQFMEQSIATVIQQIESNAPDHTAALAQVKSFLSGINANDSGMDSDVQSWITGQLNAANSYSTPSDLTDQLNADEQQVSNDESALQTDQNNLNSCENAKNDLENKLADLKSEMSHAHWYDKIKLAAEIAGVGIAIGAVYTGIGACEGAVKLDQSQLSSDQKQVKKDGQAIQNDPGLIKILQLLGIDNSAMNSQAGQGIAANQANANTLKSFEQSVDSMIKELSPSAGSS